MYTKMQLDNLSRLHYIYSVHRVGSDLEYRNVAQHADLLIYGNTKFLVVLAYPVPIDRYRFCL
jgi:hypothetical protein